MGVCDAIARKASRGTANQYQRRKHKLGYRWSTFKAQAKRRHKPLDISLQQFEVLVKSPCRYCGEAPEGPGGIDRRDNELGYIQDNCVPSCAACNYMKGTLTEDYFLAKAGAIADLLANRCLQGGRAGGGGLEGRPADYTYTHTRADESHDVVDLTAVHDVVVDLTEC
jgi:hypothetical protein